MRSLIIFALFVAAAVAVPVDPKDATVLESDFQNIGVDGYKFRSVTSDGKVAEETGELKNVGTEEQVMIVKGAFAYTGPDGVVYSVTYEADQNGFRPQGAHLPKVAE